MKKIAVLGPEGTYCDIACKNYLYKENLDYEIKYYPSILKASMAVDDNTMAMLPFENTLDGFVIESLDYILLNRLYIIGQTKLDIDFAFVSNCDNEADIENLYVQFKAYGQCISFINEYNFNIITTQSNTESLNKLLQSQGKYAAIIPMHLLDKYHFKIEKHHIADSKSNETRFFVVSKSNDYNYKSNNLESSLIIASKIDRPGILYEILKEFHNFNINLKSIMSRPMKTEMGKYRFFIECSLKKEKIKDIFKLVNNLENDNELKVNILGIYDEL